MYLWKHYRSDINKLHTSHAKSSSYRRFRRRDLTGQKFGRLTVIGFSYTKTNRTIGSAKLARDFQK